MVPYQDEMPKILFASDLDNTLIYSRRHVLPEEKICVEYYEGHPQSFMTTEAANILRFMVTEAVFVPLTTRSLAQYGRIEWPSGLAPSLALVANGAVLLRRGKVDHKWQAVSRRLVRPYMSELTAWQNKLTARFPAQTCRMVDDSYLFLAAPDESAAQNIAGGIHDSYPLRLARSGRKIYLFPPAMDKGTALKRLQKIIRPSLTVAAGDSVIDLPMLRIADVAIMPPEFPKC